MRKLTGGMLVGLLLGCALAPGVLAVPVLDQEYAGAGQPYAPIGGAVQRAQVFQVGVAGLLTSFEIMLTPSYPSGPRPNVTWGIYATTGGVPAEVPLASGSVPFSPTAPPSFTIDVSAAGLIVEPGDVLAFGVGNATAQLGDAPYDVHGSVGGAGYALGDAFLRIVGDPYGGYDHWSAESPGELDLEFRTYVEPGVVPEPGSSALLGFGLAALARRTRRRR